MATKKSTFIISAAMSQEKGSCVVINAYFLMQVQKTWYGKDKYRIIGKFDTPQKAVKRLNEILGFKSV